MNRSERRKASKAIGRKFRVLSKTLNERQRRIWCAAEAAELGYGGIACVSAVTGVAISTIRRGGLENRALRSGKSKEVGRIRKPGAGRRRLIDIKPELKKDLDALIEPATRGDPESALRWTTLSCSSLAAELRKMGHSVSSETVRHLLHELDYSLQSNRKTTEGKQNPDRDRQFKYINRWVKQYQHGGEPVISVDTKKKENIGEFANKGKAWNRKGRPRKVKTHDFKDKDLGKVIPYGVYDLNTNNGFVSVGVDHDTAEFAVESIRQWWRRIGRRKYPKTSRIMITADCGGSNGYRTRLWKFCLQQFSNETGLEIRVAHYPPGTSKWNKIGQHQ